MFFYPSLRISDGNDLAKWNLDRGCLVGRKINPCCARYKGNLGLVEMFKFYEIATDKQKEHMEKLIHSGQNPAAWEYLQKITGMELEPVDWGESRVQKWFRKLIAKFRSEP